MSFPVQAGHPDHGTGSSSQYIPAIYSALLVKKFYPTTLFGKIAQTDYEGEIKEQGDTVYIRTRPKIETSRYKKGMVLPVQNPSSPYVTLKIDQGEVFSFLVDKVDEFQSDIKLMDEWGQDAAEQMKQVIDRNLLITIAAAGAVAGGQAATTVVGYDASYGLPSMDEFTAAKGALVNGATTAKGTSVSLGTSAAASSCDTSDEITAKILRFGRYLDENNAPEDGRFVVLPTWCGEVLKSIATGNFGQAYATGQNMAPLLTGKIPNIDRMEIYFSNNLPASTEAVTDASSIIFGCKYGTTFATQITESRIIDNPFGFGKLMQGLQVYGFNIIKPTVVGVDFWKNA